MAEDPAFCFIGCIGGHSHEPPDHLKEILPRVFEIAPVSNPDGVNGIRLHTRRRSRLDHEPRHRRDWGALSRADELPHQDQLGAILASGQYLWGDFAAIREANFDPARRAVFHYAVFAHEAGGENAAGVLGIGPRDSRQRLHRVRSQHRMVTTSPGITTTLHEFGHTLGLFHGGDQPFGNGKPNYLSVMNYSFSFDGLIENGDDGILDFSRRALDDLDEQSLDENAGLDLESAIKSSVYYCDLFVVPDPLDPDVQGPQPIQQGGGPVDWNCDGDTDDVVAANVNSIPLIGSLFPELLTGFDDWANLRFDGGAVGRLQVPDLPDSTPVDEGITQEGRDALPRPYATRLEVPELVIVPVGSATHARRRRDQRRRQCRHDRRDRRRTPGLFHRAIPHSNSIQVKADPYSWSCRPCPQADSAAGDTTRFTVEAVSRGNPNRTASETVRVEVAEIDADRAVSTLAELIDTLDPALFRAPGNQVAFTTQVANALDDLAAGRTVQARRTFENLLVRVDGCTDATPMSTADLNDWVDDCPAQLALRQLLTAAAEG